MEEAGADGYIRGGGGARMGGGRLLRILALVVAAGLAALSGGLATGTASSNSRADALRSRGVPVQVTVTRCLGISSGVGMGIEYWQCRGTYTLGGRTFEEVLGGSRRLLQAGQVVGAAAVPGQPGLLSTRVPARPGGFLGGYVAPAAVGAAAVVLAGGLVWDRRRRRSLA